MAATLELVSLTDDMISARDWRSSYGVGDIPSRMRWLRADAAAALPAKLVMSDIYRSPTSSLAAVKSRRGALAPGYSNHNFGGAVDLDVTASMDRLGLTSKEDLDLFMGAADWYCNRQDHQMGFESWHYNHLPCKPSGKFSSDEAESRLVEFYGSAWDDIEGDIKLEQIALRAVGLYEGRIDGDSGPMTRSGRQAFKRAWLTKPTARYSRVLWLVAESRRYPS
jgi:hypothetical protein